MVLSADSADGALNMAAASAATVNIFFMIDSLYRYAKVLPSLVGYPKLNWERQESNEKTNE
ncbi:hypothetical protein TUMSATVNIG1_22480 [Vibrio nigripulchritudo]|nr:hypothetical protein TUMSATVNIG1_22480 [Vibrio nigripulchritudo]